MPAAQGSPTRATAQALVQPRAQAQAQAQSQSQPQPQARQQARGSRGGTGSATHVGQADEVEASVNDVVDDDDKYDDDDDGGGNGDFDADAADDGTYWGEEDDAHTHAHVADSPVGGAGSSAWGGAGPAAPRRGRSPGHAASASREWPRPSAVQRSQSVPRRGRVASRGGGGGGTPRERLSSLVRDLAHTLDEFEAASGYRSKTVASLRASGGRVRCVCVWGGGGDEGWCKGRGGRANRARLL
jgi:hypothetical protein